jgi:hypothetical protein
MGWLDDGVSGDGDDGGRTIREKEHYGKQEPEGAHVRRNYNVCDPADVSCVTGFKRHVRSVASAPGRAMVHGFSGLAETL